MNLRSLKYFVAAAELESFNKAATRENVVQSTLSHQIKNLETELGVELFERVGKTVVLSSHGKIFLDEAKIIMRAVDHASEKMTMAAQGIFGRLRVGLQNVGVINNIVAETVSQFTSRCPEVDLQLAPLPASMQIEDIISGELDAGFFHLPKHYDEVSAIENYETDWSLGIASNHPLAKKKKLFLKDLVDEKFILFPREIAPVLVDRIMATCYQGGLTPNISQEIAEERVMLNLVSVGMGVSFFLNSADNIYKERVVFKKVEDFSLPMVQAFAWKKDNQSALLQRFISTARDVIENSSA